MSLHVYSDVIQRSEEWYSLRRGIVTASAVGSLVTTKTLKPASNDESRGLAALLVAERITGYTDPTYVSDDMWRGIEDEPRARAKYSEHHAEAVKREKAAAANGAGARLVCSCGWESNWMHPADASEAKRRHLHEVAVRG